MGNISGGKGFAIGANAKSVFIEIGTLLDFGAPLVGIRKHWLFLTVSIVLLAAAALLWRSYTDRFLIPVWVLLAGMLLVVIILLCGYLLILSPTHRAALYSAGLASLLALTGLTTVEYRRAAHPVKFDPETFGVAVAQFGEGPEFQSTPRAREISQLVLERLEQQAQENPDLRFVEFRPIGLIRNESEALEEGQKLRADLVIWGRLQISDLATTLNFAILETPDKISNPTFPRVIPFIESSATGTLQIPGHNSEEIANGTTTIAAFTFGLAHFFNWDFSPAARAFQQALETAPANSSTYLYLVRLYYGLSLQWPGQLESANAQFIQAMLLAPDDPAAHLALAFGNRSLGNLEEAGSQARGTSEMITRYIKLHPENGMAFYSRALAYEILQDWESALRDYQTAVRSEPELYIARIGVIRMNLAVGQTLDAMQAAEEAIRLAETNEGNAAWAYHYLALGHERLEDPGQARLAHQKAMALAPQVDWFHFKAGQFYDRVGALQEAEQEFVWMIDVTSNKVWANSVLADFYARNGRQAEAVDTYLAALRIDPGVGGLWVALGDVYLEIGDTDRAEEAYRRAVEEEHANFYARSKYGYFLFGRGEVDAAIVQWEAARQIDPNQCSLLLNLGLAHQALGGDDPARAVYREIIAQEVSTDPGCFEEAGRRLDALTP